MTRCEICLAEFDSNKGGQLTNHIKLHDITIEDYVVKFFYSNKEPKCACGICDERPHFRRGKFSSYALGHDKFEKRKELYVKKFGQPICKECGKESGFYERSMPKIYCSSKCLGKNTGFSLEKTQAKIKESVVKSYGVNNVSKLDFVKKKISDFHKSRLYKPMSKETKQKIGNSVRVRWRNKEYRKLMQSIEYSFDERERRSLWLKKKNLDPAFREKIFKNSKNRLTKLHQRIRLEMDFDGFGFRSEQQILRYFVDELNEEKKVIVEIYGDHPHANPVKYGPDDLVRMVGQSYTASEKWEMDEIRKQRLESAGYKVFVIWESDDLHLKKEQLHAILHSKIE